SIRWCRWATRSSSTSGCPTAGWTSSTRATSSGRKARTTTPASSPTGGARTDDVASGERGQQVGEGGGDRDRVGGGGEVVGGQFPDRPAQIFCCGGMFGVRLGQQQVAA